MPFSLEMSLSWTPQSFLTVSLSPTILLSLKVASLISLFWLSLVTPSSAPRHTVVHLQAPPGGSIGQNLRFCLRAHGFSKEHSYIPCLGLMWVPRQQHSPGSGSRTVSIDSHLIGVQLQPVSISAFSGVNWVPASKSLSLRKHFHCSVRDFLPLSQV